VGILLAAGLIAGEALTGLIRAGWKFFFLQGIVGCDIPIIFARPSYILGLAVLVLIGLYLVSIPLKNAGAPDEPPPPSAVV
ncbi:MAG TPA: oligopeptide transporter, OPT family, partial [Candidatus Saccharicenans sp.]|nr:oligopeptide transporter, OPT family [Candidatus Saccharicenans sp.]